ncbi:carboxypeptidase-like regulatory domain-containing protein [Singulisphaera sp. Ch08]|uniref:Carboxypeptidase-like regulatory domain-containing protein n=1 Tax=Singulisphaera sp. Ch08 TaxID=3120278 RepID=A0AAU7C7A4_9BACT
MRQVMVAALATLLIGCGQSGPKLVPISGTVTNNGKPVEGASIVFTPDPSNPLAQPASDVSGPDGNYKAMTHNRSGVAPGKYRVSVIKVPTPPVPANSSFTDDPFMAQLSASPPDAVKKKNDPASATLEGSFDREVSAQEPVMDFDIKSKSTTAAAAEKK